MALHLKQHDSKAVLPNPEGPLSSSMPSFVRGSVRYTCVSGHVRAYHRTGINCNNLLIANARFFFSSQKLETQYNNYVLFGKLRHHINYVLCHGNK